MIRLCLLFLVVGLTATAQETLLLRSPSVSDTKIAFAYGGDIWVANRDGSHPQQITVNQTEETNPSLSPDGLWIAFTGNYDGNNDVYIIAVNGGTPKRLTFHPSNEIVRGWNGNNKIIFASSRGLWHNFLQRLFTVDIQSGGEAELIMPEASQGSVSPGGKCAAYFRTTLLAALAGCTLSTLRMYIDRKGWDIPEIEVRLNCHQENSEKLTTFIKREIHFPKPVTAEQKERLLVLANKCPVSKILGNKIIINTTT